MLKADRLGLVVVLASLLAIAAISVMLFNNQAEQRMADIRSQGISLVRALSAVPYDQLAAGGDQQGVVQVMRYSAAEEGFAYVAIVDASGMAVNEATADGIIMPPAVMPAEPAAWLGETRRTLPTNQQDVIEFHAPLLADGERAIRAGLRMDEARPA